MLEGKALEGWLTQRRGSVASGSACASSSPGARLSVGAALAVSQFGTLGSVLADSACPIQKARSGFSGAGLVVATVKMYR
ncbi:hypothetical protein [Bradyrhizobium sp. USDA 3364]